MALALVLASCGDDDVELRTWRPSDHQHAVARSETRQEPPADQDPAATEIRAASAMFRAMCASCHGESGAGDGVGAPPAAPVTDLRSAAWQDARTDAQIAEAIAQGRGGFMPPFGDQLSTAGIEALVRHVRRLGGRAPASAPSPAPSSPSASSVPPTPTSPPTSPIGGETAPHGP